MRTSLIWGLALVAVVSAGKGNNNNGKNNNGNNGNGKNDNGKNDNGKNDNGKNDNGNNGNGKNGNGKNDNGDNTKCKNINMNYETVDRREKNPSDIKTITSMEVVQLKQGSWSCVYGISYGYAGHMIWTSNNCRAQFKVCGDKKNQQKACQDMKLESWQYAYAEKSMKDPVVSMHVTKQHSSAPCTQSITFGWDNTRKVVWVNLGCRANFQVCTQVPKEERTCREVNMKKNTNAKTEFDPQDLGEIVSMWVKEKHKDSKPCTKGETFGFHGEIVWTKNKCRAKFGVCARIDPAAEAKKNDERMQDLFGGNGKTVEEIEKDLQETNKKRYQGKCKCTTYGDPHFKSFDGATIHFQGICEYTLVRTTHNGDFGDCAFDVTVENERRNGKTTVSFVKKVNIRMFGKEITLGKNKHLLVDGVRKPGVYKSGKKFKVTSCGAQDLIFSSKECGLTIAYRRNNRVEVTTNGRYSGHMEGMCGNCNQARADDLLLANGKSPDSTDTKIRNAQIGNSWHVNRNREGQPEICNKPDQTGTSVEDECSADDVNAAEEICEPLRDEKGPFAECIKKAGTSLLELFDGCVTDVCAFYDDEEEADQLRCKAFETMGQECMKLGITVRFREVTNCGVECPLNFDFFDYVPECQPTCTDPEPEGDCLKFTSPGCTCAKGYILDGAKCVEPKECGCWMGKQYIYTGDYVITDHCTKKHTCEFDEDKGKTVLTTTDFKCGANAHCDRQDGRRICMCDRLFKGDGQTCEKDQEAIDEEKKKEEEERKQREETMCGCTPWGDPHYARYDGDTIDFMGKCTYLVSGTKTQGGKCDFSVMAKNEVRGGNARVTFTREVYIETRGLLIELKQGRKVVVNGEDRLVPYENNRKGITIDYRGKYVELLTAPECNVQVSFDGVSTLAIKIPKRIGDDVVGICGNCDGIREYVTRDGTNVAGRHDRNMQIGNSWKIPNPVGFKEPADCPQQEPEPQCTDAQKTVAQAAGECGRILDPNGPFADCYNALKANPKSKDEIDGLYQSCQIDFCAYQGSAEWDGMRCNFNEEMAGICAKRGISVIWRAEHFCPKTCPPNSVYKPVMSGCQPTCALTKRPRRCDRDEVEGCECKEGFVSDKGNCIPLEECGCRDNSGDYIPLGTKFVSNDCSWVYECVKGEDGAEIQTTNNEHGKCHYEATCKMVNRKATCTCNEGFTGSGYECELEPEIEPPTVTGPMPTSSGKTCLCKANGDPRVVQFDNGRLWVNNPCKFTLVKSDNEKCAFAVEMKTVSHTIHTHQSYVYEIDVKLPDCTVRIGQNLAVQVKTNENDRFKPLTFVETHQVTDTTWVTGNSTGVSVVTDCGLVVLFDGFGEVTTTVPTNIASSTSGLCGSCDGDDSNDRLDHLGRRPSHYTTREEGHNAVARMHIVADDSSEPNLSDVCSPN